MAKNAFPKEKGEILLENTFAWHVPFPSKRLASEHKLDSQVLGRMLTASEGILSSKKAKPLGEFIQQYLMTELSNFSYLCKFSQN